MSGPTTQISGERLDRWVDSALGELAQRDAEVQRDPSLALDGGGEGYEIMLRFIAGLPDHLEPGAVVAMEIGPGQGVVLQAALEQAGRTRVQVLNDYSGRERFVFAEFC